MTRQIGKLAIVVIAGFLTVCVVAVAVISVGSRRYITRSAEDIPPVQVALIPGAGVLRSGDLSAVLKDRADAALSLYRLGKVSYFIASGDNRTSDYNEVVPIRRYLLKQGVPENAIVLDYAGFDTYSTMYRAKTVFGVTSLVVVSQSFHLPRAVFIARALGIQTYGYDADSGHYRPVNYVREVFADLKAMINLSFHREPKYLGSAAQQLP